MEVPKKDWFLFSALQVITWAMLQIKREDPSTLEQNFGIATVKSCTDHAEVGIFCKSLMTKWDKCSFQPLLRLTLII